MSRPLEPGRAPPALRGRADRVDSVEDEFASGGAGAPSPTGDEAAAGAQVDVRLRCRRQAPAGDSVRGALPAFLTGETGEEPSPWAFQTVGRRVGSWTRSGGGWPRPTSRGCRGGGGVRT